MSRTPPDNQELLSALEQELIQALSPSHLPLSGSPLYQELLNMLRYHMGWTDAQGNRSPSDPGKRLRPLLLLLSCDAAGGNWRRALPAAAAIELVHNFSLIHDDIEDNSAARRGRPALWKVWGMAQGINAGDAMFVLARQALDRLDVDPETWVGVHRSFDAATLALTQGQFLDLAFEQRVDVTTGDYIQMIRGKTAALLAASTEIGAQLASSDARVAEGLAQYGQNLGIAFQIVDDILGIWGDPTVTGKPAGDDLWEKKKSFPVLASAETDTRGEVWSFLQKPNITEADVTHLYEVLQAQDARARAAAEAQVYFRRALAALDEVGLDNPSASRLRELAAQAVQREK